MSLGEVVASGANWLPGLGAERRFAVVTVEQEGRTDTPSVVVTLIAAEVKDDCAGSGSEWKSDPDPQPNVVQQKKAKDSAGQEPERHPESYARGQAVVPCLVIVLAIAHSQRLPASSYGQAIMSDGSLL